MSVHPLIVEIDAFLAEFRISEHRFGILAASNGRLVERIRAGGRLWPDKEDAIRSFMERHREAASLAAEGKIRRKPSFQRREQEETASAA